MAETRRSLLEMTEPGVGFNEDIAAVVPGLSEETESSQTSLDSTEIGGTKEQ